MLQTAKCGALICTMANTFVRSGKKYIINYINKTIYGLSKWNHVLLYSFNCMCGCMRRKWNMPEKYWPSKKKKHINIQQQQPIFITFAKRILSICIVHFDCHDQNRYINLQTTYFIWFSSTVYGFLFRVFILMHACVHMTWLTMVGIK